MKAPFNLVSVKITVSFPPGCARLARRTGSRRHRLREPAQVGPEVSHPHELLELIDTPEPRTLEVLELQAHGLACFVDLPGALPRVPLGLERRQQAADLGEVGAIVSLVRSRIASKGDLAAGDGLLDDLGDLPDAVVLLAPADVECLRVDRRTRRGEHGEAGADGGPNVDEGPPRRPVGSSPSRT